MTGRLLTLNHRGADTLPIFSTASNPNGIETARAAFSLVELMVVVMLIGIMTALIIPEMKGTYEHALLRSTGRELIAALQLAHSQSVTVQQAHRIRLDKQEGRYVVERKARDLSDGVGFLLLTNVPGSTGPLNSRIAIEFRRPGAPATAADEAASDSESDLNPADLGSGISFYADGTADAAEIHLRDRQGFGLTLRLNPTTSRVKVVELERDED